VAGKGLELAQTQVLLLHCVAGWTGLLPCSLLGVHHCCCSLLHHPARHLPKRYLAAAWVGI
jgi:hypothetical protein